MGHCCGGRIDGGCAVCLRHRYDLLVTFGDGEPTARVNSSNALGQLPRVEGKNGGRYRVGDYIIQGSTERAYVTHVDKPGSALITPSEILLSSEQNG